MIVIEKKSFEWENENLILNSHEFGYEIDNDLLKKGDGFTPWNKLSYITSDDIITPQDFGVKANGIIDDTKALNTALKYCRYLFFPEGTYLIDSLHHTTYYENEKEKELYSGLLIPSNRILNFDKNAILKEKYFSIQVPCELNDIKSIYLVNSINEVKIWPDGGK